MHKNYTFFYDLHYILKADSNRNTQYPTSCPLYMKYILLAKIYMPKTKFNAIYSKNNH